MKNFKYFIALFLGFLNVVAMEQPRKKESDIIYTESAIEHMSELKIPQTEVQYVLLNGNVNKDKDNEGVLLYTQRSALPRPVHGKDQLVVAVACLMHSEIKKPQWDSLYSISRRYMNH